MMKKLIFYIVFLSFAAFSFAQATSGDKSLSILEKNNPELEIKKTDSPKRVSHFRQFDKNQKKKYSLIWCDGALNFELMYSRADMRKMLDKCLDCGIDAIAVHGRLPSGYVLYKSEIGKTASYLSENLKLKSGSDFDPIATFVEEGHKRDIDIFVIVSVFTGGDKSGNIGHYLDGDKDEVCVLNDIDLLGGEETSELRSPFDLKKGFLDQSNGLIFGNPIDPRVQDRDAKIICEIAGKYDVDGIILDKMRYPGLNADFSVLSKGEFEAFRGVKIERFPDDIFSISKTPGAKEPQIMRGKYFKEWQRWRASNIKDFFIDIKGKARHIKPELPVGCSVGGWYPSYWETGVNWASPSYIPGAVGKKGTKIYDWARVWYGKGYERTGLAADAQFLMIGCPYKHIGESDATKYGYDKWKSIEGCCKMAKDVVLRATPIFAGIDLNIYEEKRQSIENAIETAMKESDGIKIYDLSVVEKLNLWGMINKIILKYN